MSCGKFKKYALIPKKQTYISKNQKNNVFMTTTYETCIADDDVDLVVVRSFHLKIFASFIAMCYRVTKKRLTANNQTQSKLNSWEAISMDCFW